MNSNIRYGGIAALVVLAVVTLSLARPIDAVELQPSFFEKDLQKIKYEFASYSLGAFDDDDSENDFDGKPEVPPASEFKKRSPLKAFLMSLAVPGLGQYYNGSRIKPVAFLGVEIGAWVMYAKFQGEGDDQTADFQAYNRAYWLRGNYEQYLQLVYGTIEDPGGHDLPDTRTQQYYEMTGKYDQFLWGWDDARLSGESIWDYSGHGVDIPPIIDANDESTKPASARRLEYEQMRYYANKRYEKANWMIAVSIFNRLVSGFEAMLVARKHNSRIRDKDNVFARISVRAELKSYYERRDTPFLKLGYKF